MKPYILSQNNWYSIRDSRFELAILPWGATEAHNFHLPYGTDNFEADTIAEESARLAWENGAKVVVLPTIPIGVNTGQRDIYLDISINPSTQLLILNDVVDGLFYQGISKVLILNSHGGNDFKPIIRELGLKYPGMFLAVCNWYQALDKSLYFAQNGDHADEMETSLMLYLKPELVLPDEHWGMGVEKRNRIIAFNEGWAWAERKWHKVSADTGIGNPMEASAEKGEKYFKDLTLKVSTLICDLCAADPENLYH